MAVWMSRFNVARSWICVCEPFVLPFRYQNRVPVTISLPRFGETARPLSLPNGKMQFSAHPLLPNLGDAQ